MAETDAPTLEAVASSVVERLGVRMDERVDRTVTEQVKAQVTKTLEEMGFGADDEGHITRPPQQRDALELTRHDLLAATDPTKRNPYAPGARSDGKFRSFGEFLRVAIKDGRRGGGTDDRLQYIGDDGTIRADLGGGDLSTGGALVPEEFRAELLRLSLQPASIRRLAFQIPMSAAKISLPAIRDTSHATNVFGSVRAYWTKSGQAPPESQPELMKVSLEAFGLKLLTDIENELLADSFISAEALLAQLWAEAVPFFEEQAFIRGGGVGQPIGILNADALVSTTRNTAGHITVTDLGLMEARFLPGSRGRGVYMAHPSVLADLMTLTNGGVQVWHRDLTLPIPDVLNGRPLIINEHMSALGTVGDIALVDWKYYLIGDRQALSIDASAHAKFENGITVVRGTERLDGRPWLNSALTPAQGSATLSPFVTVAT